MPHHATIFRDRLLGSPRTGLHPTEHREGPSTPADVPQRAPGGREKATGEGKEIKPNKPLGFSLTLDPVHPYLDERGIPHELRERFGLGYL
jgi:hypothetical protein